jgi:hypothetical protein
MGTPYPSYGPPKLVETRGIEGFPPIKHQTLGQQNPKIEPLFSLIWEGKQREKNHVGLMHTSPQQILKKTASKTLQEKRQERALKITKTNEREQHIQALMNHDESSIHHKEIHTRSSLPPDHPTLSQDLNTKLSC